jgi:3-deoxy-D-manno-octulosonate 8-phosphate phosphatase (KDO 8-P phosphatase)
MIDWTSISLLVLDVDGVLTDGRLTSSHGMESKAFHVQDGCAIKVWQQAGGQVAILSGRESPDALRRAGELGIKLVRLGQSDKRSGYEALVRSAESADARVAYVGDDLPDLGPMKRCTLPIAVANAVGEVKRAARYVTRRRGGDGAVAEVVEWILRKQRRWSTGACHPARSLAPVS